MHIETLADPTHSKAVPSLVSKLLRERQEVLVLYNRLAEMKPFAQRGVSVRPLLQTFCQVLVDYMALGHFEVYQCLDDDASGSQACQRFKRLARELHPQIVKTTQIAIDFNDRYEAPHHGLDDLVDDLGSLGEALATRIELEDRLLAALKGLRTGQRPTLQ